MTYDPSADSYGSWMAAVAALRAEFEALIAQGLTQEQAHEEMRKKRGRKMGEHERRDPRRPEPLHGAAARLAGGHAGMSAQEELRQP